MIRTGKTQWCLVTVGDYAVGKTSLIQAITQSPFDEKQVTTIGMDPFQTTIYYEETPIDLVIWDTAGQERFKSLVPVYSRRSDAALIVFDMTSEESFTGLEDKVDSFRKIAETSKLVFLVATKIDLRDKFQLKEADIVQWARERDLTLFFTSAKTGHGIPELTKELARRFATSRPGASVTRELASPDQRGGFGCC
jgi:small GTP-binding protein